MPSTKSGVAKTSAPSPIRDYPGDPTVSIILPCYNEIRFIEQCLNSVLSGDFPHNKLEILVMDGMSTDGTRDVVARIAEKNPVVKLIDNPDRIKPIALNMGIAMASGEVLMRMDAHARYPQNYVTGLVRYLLTYDVVNVGGIRRNIAASEKTRARTLANLLTHRFGVGDAKHYTGIDTPEFTNIVFLFCARAELFEEMGGFLPELIRGQDREFNLRVASSGRKMMLVPDISCDYYARDKLRGFFSWAFEGGLTPFRINRYAPFNTVSWRNLIPPLFVVGIIGALVLMLIWPTLGLLALAAGVIPYAIAALLSSVSIARKEKSWIFVLLMPLAFFAWHTTYGVGAIYGIFENLLKRKT